MTLPAIRVFFRKMSTQTESLLTPVGVRGMKVLDRAKFLRKLNVPILKVTEQNVSKVIPHCKRFFLKLDQFKPVQTINEGESDRCIYLNPELISKWEDLSDDIRNSLQDVGCSEKNFSCKDVELGYDNWSYDVIFKAILPENEEIVSGYSTIGHVIHLNLREHLMPYRQLIGQVLLDKIKRCETVVNKSNTIDNTYRNFSMEVIAGNENFLVLVSENRCSFQFDFSRVYWNPRLGKEHERIVNILQPGDILFDVFCGVGPFAIPAARKKCKVFANDLNPDSYKWLNVNAEKNKVNKLFLKSYNLDGKEFICDIFKTFLVDMCKGKEKIYNSKIHITMNLPAMAVEFLKYFKGLLKNEEYKCKMSNYEILVYVYCFVGGENSVHLAKQLVIDNIGVDVSSHIIDVFNVRNVSPNKEMMRVTLKLTNDIIFDHVASLEEPPSKKLCVSSASVD